MDPGEDHFPKASGGQLFQPEKHAFERPAPASAPDAGDDTKGAAAVASILDLEQGPGSEAGGGDAGRGSGQG